MERVKTEFWQRLRRTLVKNGFNLQRKTIKLKGVKVVTQFQQIQNFGSASGGS